MADTQNITVQDQGVNWKVAFQWSQDNGHTDPWHDFEANFPADFNDLDSKGIEHIMLELAKEVARGQGIDV